MHISILSKCPGLRNLDDKVGRKVSRQDSARGRIGLSPRLIGLRLIWMSLDRKELLTADFRRLSQIRIRTFHRRDGEWEVLSNEY